MSYQALPENCKEARTKDIIDVMANILNNCEEDIVERLMLIYGLTKEDAKEYIEQYSSKPKPD